MTNNTKRKSLIFLGLVILITMVIAISLPQLELQPGIPVPKLEGGQIVAPQAGENPFISVAANKFVIIVIGLILGVLTLFSIYKMLRGADQKAIIESLRAILFFSMIACGIVFLIMLVPGSKSSVAEAIPLPTPEPLVTSPLGEVPPILLWVVGIGLLVMTVAVAIWILSSRPPKPIDLVALEAEKAWQSLKTGMDLKDVILKCYRQMSLALEQDKGIERKDFMTTGEFEKLLEDEGIPRDPIHQLTRLFDAVRYGHWQPNPTDEQEAIKCLEAIMLYSRQTRKEPE